MLNIPVYQPSLSGNERKYVAECIDSTWISSKGSFIKSFEDSFSKYINVRFSSTVSNGTVALHLALVALGIGPDDEVIVPTLTYIASVNAISYTGAKPVFVDSLESSWQLNPDDIEQKITPNTKAIMVVHLYGQPAEMNKIMKIATKHNLFVVEDCAEAFGSLYEGGHVGTFGHISTFSFFGNKTITTGEGGMVCTNDQTLFERVIHYKGQGLAAHRQYWHDVIGYNYRMTNICAAIGLAQIEQADTFISKKIAIAKYYKNKLKDLPLAIHNEQPGTRHSYWMVSILLDNSSHRDKLRDYLASQGIETRPLFYPVHTMPMYSTKFQRHPIAENLGWRGLNLPSYPSLKEPELEFICENIRNYFKK